MPRYAPVALLALLALPALAGPPTLGSLKQAAAGLAKAEPLPDSYQAYLTRIDGKLRSIHMELDTIKDADVAYLSSAAGADRYAKDIVWCRDGLSRIPTQQHPDVKAMDRQITETEAYIADRLGWSAQRQQELTNPAPQAAEAAPAPAAAPAAAAPAPKAPEQMPAELSESQRGMVANVRNDLRIIRMGLQFTNAEEAAELSTPEGQASWRRRVASSRRSLEAQPWPEHAVMQAAFVDLAETEAYVEERLGANESINAENIAAAEHKELNRVRCKSFYTEFDSEGIGDLVTQILWTEDDTGMILTKQLPVLTRLREDVSKVCAREPYNDWLPDDCAIGHEQGGPYRACLASQASEEHLVELAMRGAVPRIEAYLQRPFKRKDFRGPEDYSGFADLIPGEEGQLKAFRLADIKPPDKVLQFHMDALQAVHDTFHDGKTASLADVQVVVDAYAAVRAQIVAAAPTLKAPARGQEDYTAQLARSNPPTPGAQVLYVGRTSDWSTAMSSWDSDRPVTTAYTHSRSADGWMFYRIPGEPVCGAARYTATEPHSDGAFHHARSVDWQYARFVSCP